MSFLQEITKGYYYIVKKVKIGDEWKKEIIRRANEEDIKAYQAARNQMKDLAPVTCSNPECDKQIMIPRSQKRKFFRDSFVHYGRIDLPYCSKECQQEHLASLRKLN